MRIPVYRGEAPEEATIDDEDEELSTPPVASVDKVPPIEEDAHGEV